MASTITDTRAQLGRAGAEGTRSRSALDLATVVGLGGAFALIITAMILGGSPGSFIDLPSIMIVIGGTFGVTTVCFSLSEVIEAQRILLKVLTQSARNPSEAAVQVLELAVTARKNGVLALQNVLHTIESERFLHKALSMVVDGLPGDVVDRIMRSEVQGMVLRHEKGSSVLRKAAEISPAMGLIGTLVGLVQMLGRLDDPSVIGPSMAVALLTTFYGAVLANMVFSPLASKLERNSREEALLDTIYLIAATSIGRQENPRRLEMLLNTALPPARRVQYFD
jgi:chemotaxis protein MotA